MGGRLWAGGVGAEPVYELLAAPQPAAARPLPLPQPRAHPDVRATALPAQPYFSY